MTVRQFSSLSDAAEVFKGARIARRCSAGCFVAAAILFGLVAPARAQMNTITIVPTYDSTITSDPNAATIEASIQAMLNRVTADLRSPNAITVHITYEEVTSGLGQSSTFGGPVSYATYKAALNANTTKSATDIAALASLPAAAPVGNGNVFIQTPLGRALGFSGFGEATDATIGINTSICNISRTGTQNPSFYDLQAVAAHETDEALGAAGGSTSQVGNGSSAGTMDLFRYTAPNVRSFATGKGIAPYFSVDSGVTMIMSFNQAGGGSDYGDWGDGVVPADSRGNNPPEVQDAFGTPGTTADIGMSELTAADAVGYNLAVPVPEPGTMALVTFAAGGFLIRRFTKKS